MITSRKVDGDVNNIILLVWVTDVINDFHSTTFDLGSIETVSSFHKCAENLCGALFTNW